MYLDLDLDLNLDSENVSASRSRSPFDNTIKVSDLSTSKLLNTLEGHSINVTSSYLKRAYYDNFPSLVQEYVERNGDIDSIREDFKIALLWLKEMVTANDNVSGSWDETIKVWDLNTGTLLNTLKGYSDVSSVAISSDNSKIVSGSDDKTIKVWDLNTGTLLNTLKGYSGDVSSVAISSDNSKIVSGSDDKTIKVWDLNTGTLAKHFRRSYFCCQLRRHIFRQQQNCMWILG